MYLHLGVEGFSDDGKLVIPTTWARCGKIEYGANTYDDPSTEPELPIWNQLQTEVEQIKRDGYTQEQIDEIQAYVQSASQSASSAARSKESAAASSSLAASYVNTARNSADIAQTHAENASASASSAANLANGALQAQRAAEAAADRAEATANSGGDASLTTAQIDALNGMFQAAAYDAASNYTAAYEEFRKVFNLDSGGEDSSSDSGGEETTGTTARIAEYGKGLGRDQAITASEEMCYTIEYDVSDLFDGLADTAASAYLNTMFVHSLADGVSQNTCCAYMYVDGAYFDWKNPTPAFTTDGTEGQLTFTRSDYAGHTVAIQVSLHTPHIEDCYMYCRGNGRVIFAGKNTPYYNMANIDGTPVDGGEA